MYESQYILVIFQLSHRRPITKLKLFPYNVSCNVAVDNGTYGQHCRDVQHSIRKDCQKFGTNCQQFGTNCQHGSYCQHCQHCLGVQHCISQDCCRRLILPDFPGGAFEVLSPPSQPPGQCTTHKDKKETEKQKSNREFGLTLVCFLSLTDFDCTIKL